MKKIYPGKLLLFGEYGIVLGGDALAIPYRKKGGSFQWLKDTKSCSQLEAHKNLNAFLSFLQANGFDSTLHLELLETDIRKGIYFDSTIPSGYGLGSSGALCAAVTDRYRRESLTNDFLAMKAYFSSMESFFHGKSSGVDPLVSYLDQTLWIRPGDIKAVKVNDEDVFNQVTVFMIDTRVTSPTAPLVEQFLQAMEGISYHTRIKEEYLPMTHRLIQGFISGSEGLYPALERLSVFQLDYFRDMIPSHFVDIWRHGLLNKKYAFKLCGSGGGGYLLGFSPHSEKEVEVLFNHVFGFKSLILNTLF